MSPVTSIARSGLDAAWSQLRSSAHNVANATTEGYERRRVELHAVPQGGVTATVHALPRTGSNLAEDLVALRSAGYLFKANLHTLQAHDRMLGTLLDLHA